MDAGARYADARVMERRYEAMAARNGEVESVTQDEDAGVGVRALVGSGWGFFATPDLTRRSGTASRSGRRRGGRRQRPRRAPGRSADRPPAGDGVVGERVPRRPLHRRAGREGRPAGAGDGDHARARRRHRRGPLPDLGHRQVARVERWSSHRSTHPRVRGRDHGDGDRRRRDAASVVSRRPRAVRHARLGARPRDRPRGQRRPRRRGSRERCSRRHRARAARRR